MNRRKLLVDGTAMSGRMKGVGKYSHQVLSVLCKRLSHTWDIDVLVCDRSFEVPPPLDRCRFFDIPLQSEIGRGFLRYPHLISKHQPNVLFTPMEVIVRDSSIPRVTVCHDINELMWLHQRQKLASKRGLINNFVQRFRISSLRRCDVVVCNSEFLREEVIHRYGLDRHRTRLGYCGVDLRYYDAINEGDSGVHPFGDDQGYVLTFATGDTRENYHLLPKVLEVSRNANPNIRMVVAGVSESAPYFQKLKDEFESRGAKIGRDVKFIGFLGETEMPHLVRLYRGADIYLELSGHEGFGMQLAEALASGVLCISSRGGALAEVGDGFAQFLDTIEVPEISSRIVEAYADNDVFSKRQEQIEFTRRYSWEHSGSVIAESIEELAESVSGTSTEPC